MALVKALGCFVLGVHYHCKDAKLGASGSDECIGQQRGAKALTLVLACDSEPAKQSGGHNWIAWQFFGDLRFQEVESDAGCGQCVIAGDLYSVRMDSHEAGRNPPPDILRSLLPQIAIQHGRSARKMLPVMLTG